MSYVDGFVLPVAKKNLKAYLKTAHKNAKIFKKHGALEVRECLGDQLKTHFGVGFPKKIKLKPGETLLFSWIMYKSKADRVRVNTRVMKDPGLDMSMPMPFDVKRMLNGGFTVIVDA